MEERNVKLDGFEFLLEKDQKIVGVVASNKEHLSIIIKPGVKLE